MFNGDRANPLILLLCGLPGAGKSTLAKCIASQAKLHAVAVHQFCLDELHLQKSCGIAEPSVNDNKQQAGQTQQPADQPSFDPGAWQAARQLLLKQVQQQLTCTNTHQQQQQQRGHQVAASLQQQASPPQQHQSEACHHQPVLLLVDDINHLRSMRYEFVKLARAYGAAFVQIHVMCPVELCLRRNRERSGPARLPEDIILRLANNFEAPDPNTQWEAGGRTLTVDSTLQAEPTQLWQLVQQQWGSALPAPPSEDELLHRRMAGSTANAASVVHQFDIETRSMLTRALAGVSKESCASAAQHLNRHRKQLLERLREHQHDQHQCHKQAASAVQTGNEASDGHQVAPAVQCLKEECLKRFAQLCESVVAQNFSGT